LTAKDGWKKNQINILLKNRLNSDNIVSPISTKQNTMLIQKKYLLSRHDLSYSNYCRCDTTFALQILLLEWLLGWSLT
jgi:hypothetical protein